MLSSFNRKFLKAWVYTCWITIPRSVRFATVLLILKALVVGVFLNLFAHIKCGLPLETGLYFATAFGFWMIIMEYPAILVNTLLNSPRAQTELSVLYAGTVAYFNNAHYVLYMCALILIVVYFLIMFIRGMSKFLNCDDPFDRRFSFVVLILIPCIIVTVVYAYVNLEFLWQIDMLVPSRSDAVSPQPNFIQRGFRTLTKGFASWINNGSCDSVTGVGLMGDNDSALSIRTNTRCLTIAGEYIQHSKEASDGDYNSIRENKLAFKHGQLIECHTTEGFILEHNRDNTRIAGRINHSRTTDVMSVAAGNAAGQHIGERASLAFFGPDPRDIGTCLPVANASVEQPDSPSSASNTHNPF